MILEYWIIFLTLFICSFPFCLIYENLNDKNENLNVIKIPVKYNIYAFIPRFMIFFFLES